MIKLAFTGDILSFPGQNKKVLDRYGSYDYTSVFDDASSLFRDCNFVCGSLETPISPMHEYSKNCMNFNTPKGILVALKKMGISLLTTANNHCLDRGIDGLFNTLDTIEKAGLQSTGTRKKPDDINFYIKTINGIKVAFVAYTYDTNADDNKCYLDSTNDYMVNLTKKQWRPRTTKSKGLKFFIKRVLRSPRIILRKIKNFINSNEPQYPTQSWVDCVSKEEIGNVENQVYLNNIKRTIEEANKESDILIFLLHSGGQFNSEIGEYTNYLIDYISKCGANIIVCNHTHCVLPIEVNGNRIIAYSLGNFAFTPKEGYYIDGVYADYSIVLYLLIHDKSSYKASFSIVKNIVDQDGISKVEPVYDLFHQILDNKEKEKLLKDIQEVLKRVNYHGVFELKEEYMI